jgi:hypothetical protein
MHCQKKLSVKMKMDFIKQMRKETGYLQIFRFEKNLSSKQNSAYIVRGVGFGQYIYVHQY